MIGNGEVSLKDELRAHSGLQNLKRKSHDLKSQAKNGEIPTFYNKRDEPSLTSSYLILKFLEINPHH